MKQIYASPFPDSRMLSSKLLKPITVLTSISSIGMAGVIGLSMTVVKPAQAASCQIPKSYYKHVSCTSQGGYFLASKDSGHPVALINSQGKRVVDLIRYSRVDASKLRGGVMPVQRGNKVGYVNLMGREVVPLIYDPIVGDRFTQGWARAASNDRIVVKRSGAYGIIDTSNRTIVPFSSNYSTISDFSSGKAQIVRPNTVAWINTQGHTMTPPASRSQSPSAPLNAGLSGANTAPQSNNSALSITQTVTPLGSTSNSIANPSTSASSGAPAILTEADGYTEVWQPQQRDGKWGFVNNRGVPMITFTFQQVKAFSEGLAGVKLDGKWGFINLAGDLVIPFDYQLNESNPQLNTSQESQQPFVFKDGRAWVGISDNGSKQCIDTTGLYVKCDPSIQNAPSQVEWLNKL